MGVHKQICIAPDVAVDEGILPVVTALREFEDIQTLASCEGDTRQDGYVFFKHERGAVFLLHFVNDLADKLRARLTACCEYKIRVEWLAGSESPIAELVVYPAYIPTLANGLIQVKQDGHKSRYADDTKCRALRNSTDHHDHLPLVRLCDETQR